MKDEWVFINVRMNKELGRKLEEIAQKTHRTRSQVVRLLLSKAEAVEQPDLIAVPTAPAARKEVVK